MEEGFPKASADLQHTTLLAFTTPEFKEAIVVHVLDHKGELPIEVRRNLHAAINSVVKVPQFPKQPATAPATFLKAPILGQLVRSDRLANAVFQAWFVSQETLYSIVRGHLQSREIEVEHPDFIHHRFRGAWSYNDWMSERERLMVVHKDLNEDEVALMLCFATDKIPEDQLVTLGDEADSMNHDILDQARRYLELLPADAPEWSADVLDFLTEVTGIVDRKKMERESAAAVQAVNTRIAELMQYSSQLGYLELDLSAWGVSVSLSSAETAEVLRRMTEFSILLQEYDPIPKMGSSLSESHRLREEHDAVSQRIQVLKVELDQVLSSRAEMFDKPGPPGPDYLPKNREPEVGQGGSLSAIKLSDGTLDFSPTRTSYSIELDNAVEWLTITPVVIRAEASVDVTIETPEGERTKTLESDGGTFMVTDLNVGQTAIFVHVASEDSIEGETYTLTVTRTQSKMTASSASTDASLKGLHLSATTLEFAPGVTHFNVGLVEDPDRLTIVPETTHAAATVVVTALLADGTTVDGVRSEDAGFEIAQSGPGEGDVTIQITVTAEDNETTQLYTVVAKREAVHDLSPSLWAFVEQDDLAGAYWLARSLSAQGLNPPVPPSLFKAVQGGRWLSPYSDTYVEDLFYIVGEFEVLDDDDTRVLLRLAASIMPSLIAPETNLLAWLSSPRCLPGIEAIISPIKSFASAGYPLRPENISGDEGNQHLQGLIMQASAEAQKWLEEAPHYQTNFPWAVKVWQHLCREGVLNQMLTPVSGDKRGEINTVQHYVDLLSRDGNVEIISQAENSMGGRPPKQSRIVGNARDWLIRRIGEARGHATRWCYLVSREDGRQSGKPDNWLQEQVSSLRGQLQAECPSALEALRELASGGNPPCLVAAARCAARSLLQLAEYLNLEIQYEPLPETPAIIRDLKTINIAAGSGSDQGNEVGQLEFAISKRLLWEPSVELNCAGLPTSDSSLVHIVLPTTSFNIGENSLESTIQSRMDHRDFRFFDLLVSGLPTETIDQLKNKHSAEVAVERNTLQQAISSTQTTVEQAEKDGVIEFEGSQWNKHKHTLDDVNVKEALNFRPIHNALEGIKNELHKERMRRGQELWVEWQTLIQDSVVDGDLDKDFLGEVSSTFEKARNADSQDIRIMEDCVSQVRNSQSGEEGSFVRSTQEGRQPSPLEEFLNFYREIRDPRAHTRNSNGLNRLAQDLQSRG